MLVLSRKEEESLLIGGNIVIKVLGISSGRVRLGIEAPREVAVLRSELVGGLNDDSTTANRTVMTVRLATPTTEHINPIANTVAATGL